MKSRGRFLLWFGIAFFAVTAYAQTTWVGKCVRIEDGDTIAVLHNGREEKIRLFGIDCPESGQDFGQKAKAFTSNMVYAKTVSITVMDVDKYGRTVGYVKTPEGLVLNYELVAAGLAWWYEKYAPNDQTLKSLQEKAQFERRGLWSQPNPIPPWEFRRKGTTTQPSVGFTQPTTQTPPQTQTPWNTVGDTVYITRTGKKFHRMGCKYLSSGATPISRQDAQARGYQPCSACKP